MAAKILRGKLNVGETVTMGMGEYFFEAVEKYGDRIFQIDPTIDKSETYNQTKQRSVRVALYLKKTGIKNGDVVMLFCKNNLDDIVPVLAALYLGAAVSALDLRQDLYDIKHCIDLVKPTIMFVIEDKIELIEKVLKDLGLEIDIVSIGGSSSNNNYPKMCDLEKERWAEEDSFKPLKVDVKKDLAFILFSSGTTDLPKGVKWNHLTVMHLAIIRKRHMENNPLTRIPYPVTCGFYYNTAVWTTANCIINGIPKLVMGILSTVEQYLKVIERYKVFTLFWPAPIFGRILDLPEDIFKKYDTSSLRLINVGGSPIDAEEVLRLREKFPKAMVHKLYGSTETGTSPFRWDWKINPQYYKMKPDSSGPVFMEDMEVKFVDVQTGELLGPNQCGEILVRSPYRMLGFYNKVTPAELFDDDGFLRTGDLGYYDADEYAYVVDRINEIYKFEAQRVCPSIIENLLKKLPAIKEVVVVGVPHRVDEYHGGACIVLNEGHAISAEEIDEHILQKLGNIYRLRAGLKFVDKMPMTPSEKFRRRTIREMFVKKN